MCGRYQIDGEVSVEFRTIIERSRQKKSEIGFKQGEIFPTDQVPVLVKGSNGAELKAAIWGFPGFLGKGLVINARCETVLEKRMFLNLVKEYRCLVPASGFYEWDASRNKVYFQKPASQLLYMAGLWRRDEDAERFVILTTKANDSMIPVHSRMPLVLEEDQLKPWLEDYEEAKRLLQVLPGPLSKSAEYEQITLPFL